MQIRSYFHSNFLLRIFILILGLASCDSPEQEEKVDSYPPGTFGYDYQFLSQHDSTLLLMRDSAAILVSPAFQGKVFTSSTRGMSGKSHGWINYDAVASGKIAPHINAYGGEDRLWLGPEGGKFAIYFEPGAERTFENWQTPKGIDSEPWNLVSNTETEAFITKTMQVTNNLGTTLDLRLDREVRLLSGSELMRYLDITPNEKISWVGFESVNSLINIGEEPWDEEGGTLSMWTLGMFNPSDEVTVVIPYREGSAEDLGPVATTDYFGEIHESRIKAENGILYFRGDGKKRGKLGLSKERAIPLFGSYDARSAVLTLVQYSEPEGEELRYLNQIWEEKEEAFGGDVINSYNDGPLEDGEQMGPFYELETSSPAAFLEPNESMVHVHRTFHFEGDAEMLDQIAKKCLGISLGEVATALDY
ncbi:DUF6786 family protein [Pleomorphovibrio marinus]|uniref:DUF6786 family protein n=1 Tax=Pleomorphovibrio marinus TaxID=2164132 RepID=UPI000E0B7533|nr:DUF6786 family protein [Pleomorphovibrio marinus]